MLHSGEHCTFPFLRKSNRSLNVLQIKYLRVPDNLLDVVKDEQNRARDANRNSRGGHTGGGEDKIIYWGK
jgi:hypothetical protein